MKTEVFLSKAICKDPVEKQKIFMSRHKKASLFGKTVFGGANLFSRGFFRGSEREVKGRKEFKRHTFFLDREGKGGGRKLERREQLFFSSIARESERVEESLQTLTRSREKEDKTFAPFFSSSALPSRAKFAAVFSPLILLQGCQRLDGGYGPPHP